MGTACTDAVKIEKPEIPTEAELLAQTAALGVAHQCDIANAGLLCAGENGSGQLGTGSNANSISSVPVKDLSSGVKSVVAGQYHTCALSDDGLVRCFGENGSGQLGNGSSTNSNVPVVVNALKEKAISIASGLLHTCALLESKKVFCFGGNQYGQLGNGNTSDSNLPVALESGDLAVTRLQASLFQTCVKFEDGSQKCFGNTESGPPNASADIQRFLAASAGN